MLLSFSWVESLGLSRKFRVDEQMNHRIVALRICQNGTVEAISLFFHLSEVDFYQDDYQDREQTNRTSQETPNGSPLCSPAL